jgi:flavodoxin
MCRENRSIFKVIGGVYMKFFMKVFMLVVLSLSFISSSVSAEEKTLVVYYSTTGNTKAVCEVISKELGADLVEIKDLKNDPDSIKKAVSGGMMKMKKGGAPAGMKGKMPPMSKLVMDTDISPSNIDFSSYSRIVIGSPIWMGKLAPAVNKFLDINKLDNKKVVLLTTSNAAESRQRQETYKAVVKKSGADVAAFYQIQVKNEQKANRSMEELLSEANGLVPAIKAVFRSELPSEKTLIVYYSRTGNTKAVCEALGQELSADIVEVKDLKNRMSTFGIIGGMLRTFLSMQTKIFPEKIDMTDYSNVILSAPIWAAKVPPAMRTAIYMNGLKDKKVVMLVTCDSFYAEKYQKKTSKLVEESGGEVSAFYQILAMEEKADEKIERGKEKMIEDVIKLAPEIKKLLASD